MSISGVTSSASSSSNSAAAASIEQQIATCEKTIAAAKDAQTKKDAQATLAKLEAQLAAAAAQQSATSSSTVPAVDASPAASTRLVDVYA